MRASVRRIDLTTDPAGVEFWPTLDWLAGNGPAEAADPASPERAIGPQGRGGLWEAMAQAVQRVREVSLATSDEQADAQVIEFAPDAPHLAYLARVACSADGDDDRSHLPGADVIAMVDLRAREGR
jgi:hypothetical protein